MQNEVFEYVFSFLLSLNFFSRFVDLIVKTLPSKLQFDMMTIAVMHKF